MPYKDPLKAKAWRDENRRKNRAHHNKLKRERDARKAAFCKELLSEFSCICCGETDSDLIDWHHVNPEDKSFGISEVKFSHEDWWNEVLKCVPVCALCHRKIHKNKLCLISPIVSKPKLVTENTYVADSTSHQ
nr:hypothetical protein 40 [Pelagibacteraceae bacterium]